ncbi:MAG TPA: hypothetical protein VJ843_05485 [Candidatus Saccharimonadales bacterium]|nr:hypothetical protein [Candidatus Saccharimonadales bacterium]
MPESKKKAPLTWYILDVLIGLGAALYMQYVGSDTGRGNLATYGAAALIGAVILGIGGVVTKARSMLPFAVGALAFGALALYLTR